MGLGIKQGENFKFYLYYDIGKFKYYDISLISEILNIQLIQLRKLLSNKFKIKIEKSKEGNICILNINSLNQLNEAEEFIDSLNIIFKLNGVIR